MNVGVTADGLAGLLTIAKQRGTEDKWPAVALDWATQAEAELYRLTRELAREHAARKDAYAAGQRAMRERAAQAFEPKTVSYKGISTTLTPAFGPIIADAIRALPIEGEA